MFESSTHLYLVLEFCDGGELFDRITAKRQYGETEAYKVVRQMVSAIEHLHSRKIAHCDLKVGSQAAVAGCGRQAGWLWQSVAAAGGCGWWCLAGCLLGALRCVALLLLCTVLLICSALIAHIQFFVGVDLCAVSLPNISAPFLTFIHPVATHESSCGPALCSTLLACPVLSCLVLRCALPPCDAFGLCCDNRHPAPHCAAPHRIASRLVRSWHCSRYACVIGWDWR